MIALLAAAAWAGEPVPLALPDGMAPQPWEEAAAGVGLDVVPPGGGAWAEIAPADGGWSLRVHGATGVRGVPIEAPTTRAAREDALLLAVSLLRPFQGGEQGWATPPPPPRTWRPVHADLDPPLIAPEPPPPWIEAPEIATRPSVPGPRLPEVPAFPVPSPETWATVGPAVVFLGAEPDVTGGLAVAIVREDRLRLRVGGGLAAPWIVPVPGRGGRMAAWHVEAGAGDCLGAGWAVCGGADLGVEVSRFSETTGEYVASAVMPRADGRLALERSVGEGWRLAFEAVGWARLGTLAVMRDGALQRLNPFGFEPTLVVEARLP